ncbi:MAG TPA: pilus assembly protein TadG-related protein [Hyphomonadaceae bacterium]|nr:pilus assembly protein TadG-related protein [Hyphomonadaceae bacterium]
MKRFGADSKGNMTLMVLGIMAVTVFIIGGIVDFMSLENQKQTLQSVADHAAIAAAQELTVAKGSNDRVSSVAKTFVNAQYTAKPHVTSAMIVEGGKAVEVDIQAEPQTYFPGPIARGVKVIKAKSTAEIAGGGYVCMIGLDETAPSTLDMSDKARVTAQKCAIYSNSTNKASLNLHSLARVKADLVCVAGGVAGAKSAVTPNAPIEDCPALLDPLRDRPEPNVGLLKCDHLLTVLITGLSGHVTLDPGVYCGGINVTLNGNVTLKPGVYILNNGPLTVETGGKLEGENVGFYLTGALGLSTIQFGPSSTISLTAPKTGDMAGMLFFEDRRVLLKAPHRIASDNARKLVGTIYLPNNQLTIDSKHPIADQSDYTVIIAKKFVMQDGPELVLNTDYEHSPIPVPDGVGNKSRPMVHLARGK